MRGKPKIKSFHKVLIGIDITVIDSLLFNNNGDMNNKWGDKRSDNNNNSYVSKTNSQSDNHYNWKSSNDNIFITMMVIKCHNELQ